LETHIDSDTDGDTPMPALLDPREAHFRIPSSHAGLSLFLRHLPPLDRAPPQRVVLYVHGATFPSALSIAHRFDGRSWRDELCAAGFHVWGLDFHGYGASDPYPAMSAPPDGREPLCTAEDASRQLEQAVRFICQHHATERISIIAHSWGTIVAGRLAARGERWLDSDPVSRTRTPPSVRTPSGPWFDIGCAWAGDLAYEPARVGAPVAIIRGEWDSMCTDADAAWLFGAFTSSPIRRDVKISRGTHLMHLEASRYALYRETQNFLAGGDEPAGVA
jgi:pimeloyl-ACP methyl ester carboxylesterase